MRIITEKELYKLWKENKEKALDKLTKVDYVMDDGAWFIPSEFFLKKLLDETRRVI